MADGHGPAKGKNRIAVDATNAVYDVNMDGGTNLIDMTLIKSLNGRSETYPQGTEYGRQPNLAMKRENRLPWDSPRSHLALGLAPALDREVLQPIGW